MVEVPETAGCLEMSQGRQQLQSWTATFPFVLSKPLELAAAACSLLLADKSGRQQYEQKVCTMYLVIASGQQLQESVGSLNTLYDKELAGASSTILSSQRVGLHTVMGDNKCVITS